LESLHDQGKVSHFGVSNMHWHQIDYIDKHLGLPIIANQLELSLANLDWLEEGLFAGNSAGKNVHSGKGTLEYCKQNGVQLQAWGCLAQGLYSGRNLDGQSDAVIETARLVKDISHRYEVSREAIVLAWLMRHPAGIQPVIGTTDPKRIADCCEAAKVLLSREDWYALYVSARGAELP
ncbi:MAG: aldo/keto reductase, partial [Acidiferrobacterales bacterium]|nr:aldo/keto reductase [Acidiferrobacterales bacterium]